MSIIVSNSNTSKRFTINFGFDKDLIDIIKTHSKAFFDLKKKEWSLPITEKEKFLLLTI